MSGVCLRIRLGGEEYALPIETVREVANAGHRAPVPGAPAAILGVGNLRGAVVPVVDLALVLGLPSAGDPPLVAVVEHDGRIAALGADEIHGVTAVDAPSEPGEGRFVTGSSLQDGALVGIIAVDEMLEAIEEGTVG